MRPSCDLIDVDYSLKVRFDILVSIPGISTVTAFTLIIEMPELGELDEKAAASLCGLAPMSRQSGRWTGRAFIAGGRAIVRQALYMPALVAARFNPDLKATYNALIGTGKPPKVAITAIMRKLIVLANALLRDNRSKSRLIKTDTLVRYSVLINIECSSDSTQHKAVLLSNPNDTLLHVQDTVLRKHR
ncbi:Transposase IS116/IS110/IS902 family protein [Rhizobium tibeticum]|uniref:Transposase IS116/IS110/IS902 family protein n=1 Tax=Rhizobium tibeticum TaxID=501024 RepID=A0A1H8W3W9_9HYPH|nr:Transposase IS116/IS110/IS902 family protein [Rhizobium tibeticum]SEP21848.1 Transposase IS116/IS110/IS902 family protein [Rhizobium tibeticum]